MQNLYDEKDLLAIRAQLKRRLAMLGLLSLVMLGVVVWTLLLDNHKENRPELWTTLAVMLWGFMLIFWWDFFCRPLSRYARHLDTALHGRTHEDVLTYSRQSADVSLVDGVSCRDLIFLGEPDKHGDRDRMLYWDCEKNDPPFREGEDVRVRYYDRFLTGYEHL